MQLTEHIECDGGLTLALIILCHASVCTGIQPGRISDSQDVSRSDDSLCRVLSIKRDAVLYSTRRDNVFRKGFGCRVDCRRATLVHFHGV
ncbi:hypothetical protein CEXT_221641 [Caerostris extrusa]|uniref:Secreted protein n=1 Tax=Caerostris extrusa TaxID=172846 RepID=A0AAV4QCR3_CAEEX|nr:hypothetical protein CEXT_221641 [Caerostris extrusa]